jgi:hypothetical protein
MSDIDFDGAADIAAAIEAAGGDITGFAVDEVQRDGGLSAMVASLAGGGKRSEYTFELSISGPTTRDIPDIDAGLNAEDAIDALRVAAYWTDDEGLDALTSDLSDVANRIHQQANGDAHPADEMEAFQGQP